jgi:hypothetical protein
MSLKMYADSKTIEKVAKRITKNISKPKKQ